MTISPEVLTLKIEPPVCVWTLNAAVLSPAPVDWTTTPELAPVADFKVMVPDPVAFKTILPLLAGAILMAEEPVPPWMVVAAEEAVFPTVSVVAFEPPTLNELPMLSIVGASNAPDASPVPEM